MGLQRFRARSSAEARTRRVGPCRSLGDRKKTKPFDESIGRCSIQIDPELIERFGRTMRENFTMGSVPFRKAYLQSFIDKVEVDDHVIRIKGSKDQLEKAVMASRKDRSWCSETSTRWRTTVDEDGHYCFALALR